MNTIKDKHIIFFCPGFPNDENETDCIPAMQNFIKGFCNHSPDIKISVVSFFYPFKTKEYQWHCTKVYALGKKKLDTIKVFKWIDLYKTIKRIYNPNEETVIQSFWLNDCALAGNWTSKLFKIKHFCMVMGQDASFNNRFRHILPINKLTIVCPNELSNQKLKKVFNREADYIIPRGIDDQNFNINNLDTKNIDIIGVGNVCELKNYNCFVRIVKNLKKDYPDIRTLIIGKGESEEEIKNLIAENDLENNITMTGFLKRELVLNTMSKSKILLHTSTFEDESYAITEALQAGMYGVGFEEVNNKRENLFLGNTETELTSICNSILKNYTPPKSIKVYTVKQMISDFEEIYFNAKIMNK